MKTKRLTASFFNRDTLSVAKDLLGKFMVRRLPSGRKIALMITDVEAYDGFKDRGSHASRGETARNRPMFGKPGCWYIYFTYGMHWLMNVVTREKGYPAAVLIRGGKPAEGGKTAAKTDGPAKVARFLKVNGKFSGRAASVKTGLWIAASNVSRRVSPRNGAGGQNIKIKIRRAGRVGIDYAGKHWAAKPWRFYIAD